MIDSGKAGAGEQGEVTERLKVHAWKACGGASPSWVRIPPSPPSMAAQLIERPMLAPNRSASCLTTGRLRSGPRRSGGVV